MISVLDFMKLAYSTSDLDEKVKNMTPRARRFAQERVSSQASKVKSPGGQVRHKNLSELLLHYTSKDRKEGRLGSADKNVQVPHHPFKPRPAPTPPSGNSGSGRRKGPFDDFFTDFDAEHAKHKKERAEHLSRKSSKFARRTAAGVAGVAGLAYLHEKRQERKEKERKQRQQQQGYRKAASMFSTPTGI